MTNGPEKSDPSTVAKKPANNPGRSGAESVERREGAKGNSDRQRTHRTPSRESVSSGLLRVRERARRDKKERFTALLHHVTVDLLRTAFLSLKRKAAPGVDDVTWPQYEQNLEVNLVDLHGRVHRGAYRALPSRRTFIPKEDGTQRPLGIASLEDKIVQRAVVEVLNAIYEEDFIGFSYGFRPGRSQHDALDALATGITRTKVNWILDCDIRSYFDSVSHDWLVRFIEHRIADPRMIRLIRKWLKAGVLDDGKWSTNDTGTPQGAVVTPWTQKRTSSLSVGLPAGVASRWLILDVKSITLMSHGAIHASAEGAKVECGLSTSLARDRHCGSGLDVGTRARDLTAPCISVSRGSCSAQTTFADCSACCSYHIQDFRRRHSRTACVCHCQRADIERGCHTRHLGLHVACTTTWLSDCASVMFVSNIPSIV